MILSILFWMTSALFAYFVLKRLFLEHFYINYVGKFVFITGCDSGFGRLLAVRLLKMGVNVFAGCYTEVGCENLLKQGRRLGKGQIFTVQIDITNDESVMNARIKIEKILDAQNAHLHGVVNNAGVFTVFGPDDWCTTEEYLASLNVNTLGAIRVCHNFLPLVKKCKGRVVTMGSTTGRLHGLYVGPYVTAKFAVEAYMDCLRLEMRPFGVSVHILEPGAFKTDLLNEKAHYDRVNKAWEKLPSVTKNEYGEQFKENFKVAWQTGVNLVANPNLQWVCRQLCSRTIWYAAGWDAIFCFIPLSLLPTWIQDTVLHFMYSMQPGPPLHPSSLQNKKEKMSLIGRTSSWFENIGHISILSIAFVAVYIKSLLPYVTARTIPNRNNTSSTS
ncbi:hypothetical protein KIN20_007133 [Parelaphostrongylus tenuis]|uniref:Uncharacterized protein n=1 Tax=Parelaphostrongylus tenuis TaxID=148309 RepID=A0AAD5MP44_PARTN|nr:hypothetical protein KIN20_007133 [Parelaphostrongylus tenuis]